MRCVRLVPKLCLIYFLILAILLILYYRCTTLASDLDGEFNNSVECSHEHTEAIDKAFNGNMKSMWEGYGIIGDVTVSCPILYYHGAIYTNSHKF